MEPDDILDSAAGSIIPDAESLELDAPLTDEELLAGQSEEDNPSDDEGEDDFDAAKTRAEMQKHFTKRTQALAEKEKELDRRLAEANAAKNPTPAKTEEGLTLESYYGSDVVEGFTENERMLAEDNLELRKAVEMLVNHVKPIVQDRRQSEAATKAETEVKEALSVVGAKFADSDIQRALKAANGSPTKAVLLLQNARAKRSAPTAPTGGGRPPGKPQTDQEIMEAAARHAGIR